jgi:hypothetical protein
VSANQMDAMASGVMAQNDHRMFTTPVSVADGLKRGDNKTWSVLLIAAALAIVLVLLVNAFVEKPEKINWPTGPKPAVEQSNEPRTFDVAPPGAAPAKPRQ